MAGSYAGVRSLAGVLSFAGVLRLLVGVFWTLVGGLLVPEGPGAMGEVTGGLAGSA